MSAPTPNDAPVTLADAADFIVRVPNAAAVVDPPRRNRRDFAWAMIKVLEFCDWYLSPLALLVFAVIPFWLVDYRLVRFLVEPKLRAHGHRHKGMEHLIEKDFRAGVIIFWMSVVPQFLCWSAFGYMLWQGFFVAPRYKLPPTPPRDILQCRDRSGTLRWCEVCSQYQDNRVSHSRRAGRCLPHFDHTCHWWGGPLWMNNVKANANFIFWGGVHNAILGGIGIWSFTQKRIIETQYAVGLLVFSLFYAYYSYKLFRQFWDAISTNVLGVEHAKKDIYFIVNAPGRWNGVYHWNVAKPEDNPWDLGRAENRRQVLGRKRSWLFFWTSTPIMETGPVFNDRLDLAAPTREDGRTRAMVRSGAEEIELEGISVTQRR